MPSPKSVPCPICQGEVRAYFGNLVRCPSGHRFYVKWASPGSTERALELASHLNGESLYKVGDVFPLPNEVDFD